jgi:hypothetical protein
VRASRSSTAMATPAVISAFGPARSFPPKRLSAGDESAAAQKTNVSGGAPCDSWRPSQGVGGPSQGGSTLPLGLVSRVGVIRPKPGRQWVSNASSSGGNG